MTHSLSTRFEAATLEQLPGLLCDLYEEMAVDLDWSAKYYTEKWVPLVLAINTPESLLAAAMMLVPEGWVQGHAHWPWYDNGKYIAPFGIELHSMFSSGGGPKVFGFGNYAAAALGAAIARFLGLRMRFG